MKTAFLGTGLMGSGFVRRLLLQGHTVHVWNRSPASAKALEAHGAKAFAASADAVAGVERVHLSLAEDASVDAVLEPLADVIPASCWIIDHTTTTPSATGERARRWAGRGRVYLHAPVFMGPVNAAEGTGVMLLSGDLDQCARVLPELERMTGKVFQLGPQPERAAAFKLFGNLAFLGMSALAGDIVRLADATGVDPQDAAQMFDQFNPGQFFPARFAKVAEGPFEPASFIVSMARKDVRLMVDEAAEHGCPLVVMPTVAAHYDAAIARGESAMDSSSAFRHVPVRSALPPRKA
jgi:3-hydroxyisobutyrate dehydrogenase